jgi:hypothetical protein
MILEAGILVTSSGGSHVGLEPVTISEALAVVDI